MRTRASQWPVATPSTSCYCTYISHYGRASNSRSSLRAPQGNAAFEVTLDQQRRDDDWKGHQDCRGVYSSPVDVGIAVKVVYRDGERAHLRPPKTRASRRLFQEALNTRMALTTIPGVTIGNAICLERPEPGASINLRGIQKVRRHIFKKSHHQPHNERQQ